MKPVKLICFAAQDLAAWRWAALGVSATISATIAAVCAITVAAYGLAFGSKQVAMWRIEQDPLALCLWVGDSVFTKRQIDSGLVAHIRTALAGVERGGGLRACFPFRVCESFEIERLDGLGCTPARGRTVLVDADGGDPLLDSLGVRSGRRFQGPDDAGVIITPDFLPALGLSRDASPPALVTFMIRGRPEPIPVLAITQHNLPDGLLYVLPEQFEQRLRVRQPDPRVQVVYSGAMHPEWPKYEEPAFPRVVRAMIESAEWSMEAETQGESSTKQLALRSKAKADSWPRLSDWRRYLERIGEEMAKATGRTADASFIEPDALGAVPRTERAETVSTDAYDVLGVYCQRVGQLRAVAETCAGIPLLRDHINRRTIEQIEAVDRETQAALRIVLLYEAVVVGMAVLNLLVIQLLRAWQKIAEAGMLKAIGMTWWQLIQLVVTETGLLWAAGVAFGIPAGFAAGRLIAGWKYELAAEVARGFEFTGWQVAAVASGSCAVCLVSSLLATVTWHVASPARLLRSE